MKNFTPEMIEKAKTAKTAEELLALAQENGVELSEEEAKTCFAQLQPVSGELSDDELDNVAGGGCGNSPKKLRDYGFYSGAAVVDTSRKYCCRYNCRESKVSTVGGYTVFKVYDNSDGTWYVTCGNCDGSLTNKFSGNPQDYGFVHATRV